jgi:tetratricopeptide (TPR) repeat protein
VLVIAVLKLRKLTGVHAQSLSTLVAIFLGLVTISLVSPENIGFSVWSWVFAGAIAALSLQQVDETKKVVKKQSQSTDKLIWVLAILLITTTPAVYLVRTVYQADQGIWNSYAVAFGGQGALKDLLVSIENDVAHAPREQHYKALAASMSLGLGQNSLARDYSKLLLEINPRSMNAYKIIAISYEKEDKLQDAIIARLKYLEFDKYGLENLDKLARDNLALGNKADALTYLANMKKIQAENPLVIALEKELTP